MREGILPEGSGTEDERIDELPVVGVDVLHHPADPHQRDRAVGSHIAGEAVPSVFLSEMEFQIGVEESLGAEQASRLLLVIHAMVRTDLVPRPVRGQHLAGLAVFLSKLS